MILEYITAAMRQARYERLPDDSLFYGEIPGFEEYMQPLNVWKTAGKN